MMHDKRHADFSEKPVLVFWETTRSCMLACRHCRASAIREPLPGELNTDDGIKLIDMVAAFGSPAPVMILTGGDPLMRKDLFLLLEHARKIGVKCAVSPAVSELLTQRSMERLRDSGVSSISISLDGATAETHDRIRAVAGTFDRTLTAISDAVRLGLNIQVNTTVMRSNISELAGIFHTIRGLGVRTWEVFFLIKTGRGAELEDISQHEYETVCNFLYDASRYGILIRLIEGPFIRRVAMERVSRDYWNDVLYSRLSAELERLEGAPPNPPSIAPRGTLDGDGIVFVAHDGAIYPGGFIPLALGNVASDDIVDVYRNNQVLRNIRGRNLGGYCNECEFKQVCGGSRARAYAHSGDPLASDPACIYPKLKGVS